MGMRMMMKCAINALLMGLILVSNAVESASNHGAPAPAVECSSVVMDMADCLSFVTNSSTTRKPEGMCCSGLKTVLKTNAECLCETFKNSAQLGISLNLTKAMTLPAACHVSAPSVTNCELSAGSGAAPALSPMALSPSSMAAAPITNVGSNVVAPAPAPGSSGSTALAFCVTTLVMAVVVVSFCLF